MHLTSRGLLCVGVLIVTMSAAAAQSRATGADIRGHVQDASGGRLAAATISARNRATNIVRDVTTDGEGQFVVVALEPGEYDLRAQHEGFSPAVRERLAVQIGELVEVTFALEIAPIEQSVRVEAGAPVVNPSQTAVSTIIGTHDIEQLPLNGRRFIELAALAAGVTTGGPVDPAAETSGLSVLGQRPVANNLMVDGFDNNDRILGGPSGNFSQESVREFQVLTSSYPAEFGNATGGVVNIVTRSGSNSIHGTTFLYHRNTGLNARGYFEQFDPFGTPVDLPKATFRQNQFGGSIGAPLRRDRTFLFAAVEMTPTRASNVVTIEPRGGLHARRGGLPGPDRPGALRAELERAGREGRPLLEARTQPVGASPGRGPHERELRAVWRADSGNPGRARRSARLGPGRVADRRHRRPVGQRGPSTGRAPELSGAAI